MPHLTLEKGELFEEADPRADEAFDVGELTGGYRYDCLRRDHVALGIGAAGTLSMIPRELRDEYGDSPYSGLLFVHAGLH